MGWQRRRRWCHVAGGRAIGLLEGVLRMIPPRRRRAQESRQLLSLLLRGAMCLQRLGRCLRCALRRQRQSPLLRLCELRLWLSLRMRRLLHVRLSWRPRVLR